jgi:hypothetical protein
MKGIFSRRFRLILLQVVCLLFAWFWGFWRPHHDRKIAEQQLTAYALSHGIPRSSLLYAGEANEVFQTVVLYATEQTFRNGIRIAIPLLGQASLTRIENNFSETMDHPGTP